MTKFVTASLLTQRVLDWLENASQPRVLHVFGGVTNLINQAGDILSLVNPILGAGPFALTLEENIDFQQYVTADSVVAFGETQIYCGDLEIDLTRVTLWEAKPDWAALSAPSSRRVSWLVQVIENILIEEAPSDSMAQVLLAHQFGAGQSRFFDRAFQGIDLVRRGLVGADKFTLQQGAKQLAGLGIGLTPAGDDFLIGVMHGLWLVRPMEEAQRVSDQIESVSSERTVSISGAWLKAAAAGETGEPWHALLAGFLAEDQAAVEAAVARILPTGHTSGADALAGFVLLLGLEELR